VLSAANNKVVNWTASPSLKHDFDIYAQEGWGARGKRHDRLLRLKHPGFVVENDLYNDGELDSDPLYRDFLRPRGLGWATGTAILLPTNDMIVLSLEREYIRGPVEQTVVRQLDTLRPHLARSALLAARLQMERADVVSKALAALRLPALVFDVTGKVLSANQLIESLPGYVYWRAQGQFSLVDKSANQLLRDATATIALSTAAVLSFPVRDSQREAKMVAHVIPIRKSAYDIFSRCAAALVMTPVALPEAPPVELVQSLFDLTPSEAWVARSLAAGKVVDQIALDKGISPNTVRTHVRKVLEKTGCQRQTEVVALFSGIVPPGAIS
jgi:DNA-binding CsgD family transcriptional regulator